MKRASIRELRYAFNKIERLLQQGEQVQVPEARVGSSQVPDFMGRMKHLRQEEDKSHRSRTDCRRSEPILKIYVDTSFLISL
jgi:hypothetical protein